MKVLLVLALSLIAHIASAQSFSHISDEGLPSQAVVQVDVEVAPATTVVCATTEVPCFQLNAYLNNSDVPAMTCEARVGQEGLHGHGVATPIFDSRSFDARRIYKRYDHMINGLTVNFATFIESIDGNSSGFGIYEDPKHDGPTHGGIDVSGACAQQLQKWVKSALMTEGGSATITTKDTK